MGIDINEIMDYEAEHTIQIVGPGEDEAPTGISVTVRSAGSRKAKDVLFAQQQGRMERLMKGKSGVNVRKSVREENERVASCIVSWEWGENTYAGEKPENSMRWYIRVLEEQPWFYAQVKEACETPEHFMKASATRSLT